MRDVRVCVFGDSFVAGVGDPKALGWVGRVATRTPPSTGVALTLYSLGVRGQSTEDVVVRMPLEVSPRFARGDEHGVVLAVGMADAFADVPVARSAATLEFGLQSIPTSVGSSSARRRSDPRRSASGWPALDTAFARVCERLDVPYVSTYAPLVGHGPWAGAAVRRRRAPGAGRLRDARLRDPQRRLVRLARGRGSRRLSRPSSWSTVNTTLPKTSPRSNAANPSRACSAAAPGRPPGGGQCARRT